MNINKAIQIDGWMSEQELEFLAETASKSELIVEFGCYKGRSTRAMADNTKGKIIAVDPWMAFYPDNDGNAHGIKADVYEEFRANLLDKMANGTVIPIKMLSYQFYMAPKADFVFIDGDHRFETVLKDIEVGLSLLKSGGILGGHDYTHGDWPGVKQAVDKYFPQINQVNSIWWVNV